MKEQLQSAKLVRETEKAILVEVLFGDEFTKQLWFPKSATEVRADGSIHAESWIIDAKQKEVGSYAPNIATVFVPTATPAPVAAKKSKARKSSW